MFSMYVKPMKYYANVKQRKKQQPSLFIQIVPKSNFFFHAMWAHLEARRDASWQAKALVMYFNSCPSVWVSCSSKCNLLVQ